MKNTKLKLLGLHAFGPAVGVSGVPIYVIELGSSMNDALYEIGNFVIFMARIYAFSPTTSGDGRREDLEASRR